MAKPGIMLYFDILEPIRALSNEERGQLLLAMLEYGREGREPEFDGMLALAWGFIRPKLDKDSKEYSSTVLKRRYANWCRVRKRKGEQELSYEAWLQAGLHMQDGDCIWYPTTTTTKTTTTSTTTATAAAVTTTTTDDAAAAAERAVKALGGTLGRNVVFLSESQVADLLEKMDIETFDHYVDKLADFIIRNGARVKNHYETILRWYREDGITK